MNESTRSIRDDIPLEILEEIISTVDHLQDLKNVSAVSPLLKAAVQNKIALMRMDHCEVWAQCTMITPSTQREDPAYFFAPYYVARTGGTEGVPFSLVWETFAPHITTLVLELPLSFDCAQVTQDMIFKLKNIQESQHVIKHISIRPGWDDWEWRWNNNELPLEDFGRVNTVIRMFLSGLIANEQVENIDIYGYYDFELWGHYERHEGICIITEA